MTPKPVMAAGAGRAGRVLAGTFGREKISTALLPPKPKELLMT